MTGPRDQMNKTRFPESLLFTGYQGERGEEASKNNW